MYNSTSTASSREKGCSRFYNGCITAYLLGMVCLTILWFHLERGTLKGDRILVRGGSNTMIRRAWAQVNDKSLSERIAQVFIKGTLSTYLINVGYLTVMIWSLPY